MSSTFVDGCLAGDVRPEEIDDWVDAWHDNSPGSEGKTLDEYLGFDETEGALWARKPSALEDILEQRWAKRYRVMAPNARFGDSRTGPLALPLEV